MIKNVKMNLIRILIKSSIIKVIDINIKFKRLLELIDNVSLIINQNNHQNPVHTTTITHKIR